MIFSRMIDPFHTIPAVIKTIFFMMVNGDSGEHYYAGSLPYDRYNRIHF